MKRLEILITLLLLVIAGLLGYVIYLDKSIPKVGYVRSAVLLEKYSGRADIDKALEKKMGIWQANIDTLESNYKKAQDDFNARGAKMNTKERNIAKESLEKQFAEMEEYVSAVEKKAGEESQKLTQGVVSRIDQYIKKYADEHGYDLILGVTVTGNILYGNESIDVTEDLLKELNKDYSGQ